MNMVRGTELIIFAVLCVFQAPWQAIHAASLDRNLEQQIRSEVRGLRNLKNKDGKAASYLDIVLAKSKLIEKHKNNPAAVRLAHKTFFWDVVRNQRNIELKEKLVEVANYMSTSSDLDEKGKFKMSCEQVRMLGELNRDLYTNAREKLIADPRLKKDEWKDVLIELETEYVLKLWGWREEASAIEKLKGLDKQFPESQLMDRKIQENIRRFIDDRNRQFKAGPFADAIRPLMTRAEKGAPRDYEKERLFNSCHRAEFFAAQFEKALVYAEKLIVLVPKNASYILLKARDLHGMGKAKDAQDATLVAILQSPKTFFQAQEFLIDMKLEAKELDEALGMSRILFDIATSQDELTRAVQKIAKIMTLRDGHLAKANAFIMFQKDGKGEVKKLPRYVEPAFQKAILSAAEKLNGELESTEYRKKALYLLLAGKQAEAMKALTNAYYIIETKPEEIEATMKLMAAALRAENGQALAAQGFLTYQKYGSAGVDNKQGTADDCKDEIAKPVLNQEVLLATQKELFTEISSSPSSQKAFDLLIKYASALSLSGKPDEAIGVTYAAYRLAHDSKNLDKAVSAVASALRARDHNLIMANRFLVFQKYGPKGKDKNSGTADDLVNPLKDTEAPLPAAFIAACEGLKKQMEDAKKPRGKGYALLLLGQSKEALISFKESRTQMGFSQNEISRHTADILAGLKARDWHTFTGQFYLEYQQYGPNGKDGKQGTSDDLKDPLAGI